MKIVAISGSLRQESYNTNLLKAIKSLSTDININLQSLREIPLYSEDREEQGVPQAVINLATEIKDSAAVIIATPEYNGTTSGALLNTLEWLSRESAGKPLRDKVLAVTGATTGGFGTDKAQMFVKTLGLTLEMIPMSQPKLRVSHAEGKFNSNGKLIDQELEKEIINFIAKLRQSIERFNY
jgi:chromate reductase